MYDKIDKWSKIVIYGAGMATFTVIGALALTDSNWTVASVGFVGMLIFGRGLRKVSGL